MGLFLHLKPKTLPLPLLSNLLQQHQDLIEQDQPTPERVAWPEHQWLGNLPWEGHHRC